VANFFCALGTGFSSTVHAGKKRIGRRCNASIRSTPTGRRIAQTLADSLEEHRVIVEILREAPQRKR
jgi:hypothetical protein